MTSPDVIRREVHGHLYDFLGDQRHRWQAVSPLTSVVFDEIETLVLSNGKLLRPQFLHWGWVAAGGEPHDTDHHRLGAAIEMLHAFALFHDDVIDDSASRRGIETTHRRVSRDHHEDDWAGESRRFGEGVAILIGDIAYSLSDVLVPSLSDAARAIWNEMRLEVNIGQFLDTVGSARRDYHHEHSHLVARYKTAKYTIERPLHLGALAAQPDAADLLPVLSAYGIPLGTAFQFRDDILGAFGDEAVTGKSVGGDFREGKPTVLVAQAREGADDTQIHVLNRIGDTNLSTQDIQQIQQVVIDTGALARTEELIIELRDQAIQALHSYSLAGNATQALEELAVSVTQRVA